MKLISLTYLFVFILMTKSCFVFNANTNLHIDDLPQTTNSTSISDKQTYYGWWIYGGGHHVFKDEFSLEEWDIIFLNENKQNITDLYLSISQMEYFPIEIIITATVNLDKTTNKLYLNVLDFDITYVEGCGD